MNLPNHALKIVLVHVVIYSFQNHALEIVSVHVVISSFYTHDSSKSRYTQVGEPYKLLLPNHHARKFFTTNYCKGQSRFAAKDRNP